MKKITAAQRNKAIYQILLGFLKKRGPATKFAPPFDSSEVESLFQTSIWGHREIVLTIILARIIDSKFTASKDFYACNPRSIFEQPIRKALREYGIPHRKSGPLNVAKNSKKINRDWAADKHGGAIALNVVRIVEKIESVSSVALKNFASAYVSRYKEEAKKVKEMEVNLPPQENPIHISKLCTDLIDFVPDGGATPQFIIGLLMESINEDRHSKVVVSGHKDSVSTTNTTSKKPGDIIERMIDGFELVYEVTTKKFSEDRLMESHEAATSYSRDLKDIFVICRPQDVLDSLEIGKTSYLMATTRYRDLSYYFLNIYDYVRSILVFLTPNGRKSFYGKLTGYVNQTNTSEKVKRYFKEWHSGARSL